MIRDLFNATIRRKILLSFTIIFIFLIFLVATSLIYINRIEDLTTRVTPHSDHSVYLNDISISLESTEDNIDKYINLGSKEYQIKYDREINHIMEILQILITEHETRLTNKFDKEVYAKLHEFSRSIQNLKTTLAVFESNKIDEIEPNIMNSILITVYSEIKESNEIKNGLVITNANYIKVNIAEQKNVMSQLISQFLLIVTVIILIGLISSYIISSNISNPIKKLRDATNEAAEGNLDIKINIKSNDESGELASAFNHMIVSLKKSKEEIENYSKGLEKKVAERTKELEKSKNKLDGKVIELQQSKSALLNIMDDLETAQKELEILNMGLEQKVKERTAEVDNLLKQKDEFISQLSHDLRTPLTPLVNLIPLLENTEKNPKSKKLFGLLRRNINRMKDIVIKTLKLAELNAPSTMFDMKDIKLWEEVENSIKDQHLICDEKKFTVENKLDENIFVKADKLRLSEVFDNLISNAVKYSPPGSTITVDAHDDGDFVTVSIMDSGNGLTSEQINHIFDEFYKADKSRHDLESSGLGLTICKRIVEKHGGRIWAESPGLGKGSMFYFTIPKSINLV